MEQRILEQERACLYYDLMQELKQYDLNPIMKHDVKDELYAMLKENELRNESIEHLFPQGTSVFIKNLTSVMQKKTKKEHILELLIFLFGVCAIYGVIDMFIHLFETSTLLQYLTLDLGFMMKLVLYVIIVKAGKQIRQMRLSHEKNAYFIWSWYAILLVVAVPLIMMLDHMSCEPLWNLRLPCLSMTLGSIAIVIWLIKYLLNQYHQDVIFYLKKGDVEA